MPAVSHQPSAVSDQPVAFLTGLSLLIGTWGTRWQFNSQRMGPGHPADAVDQESEMGLQLTRRAPHLFPGVILLQSTYRAKRHFNQRLRSWALVALLFCAWLSAAQAQSMPVRYVQGTIHAFLELRGADGRVVASGDMVQVVHGYRVTAQTVFRFKDGSIDDETTVFSQHGAFQLITDHRVQKGPWFPHPMDVMIDVRHGQVTVRSIGKDGKEGVKTNHINLPRDLVNGMVPLLVENVGPDAAEITVSMLVAAPNPRIVKLVLSRHGEEDFLLGGTSRKASHFEIKIELGGLAGIVAPIINKDPPNIQIWIDGGRAPVFLREQGPIFPDGPIMTIQLASPVWPEAPKS